MRRTFELRTAQVIKTLETLEVENYFLTHLARMDYRAMAEVGYPIDRSPPAGNINVGPSERASSGQRSAMRH